MRALGVVMVAATVGLCFACGSDGDSAGSGGSSASGGSSGGGSGGSSAGGSGGSATGGSGGSGAVTACGGEPTHSGEATYYDFADGSGNCSFDPTPNDLMVGAMNHTDYAASAACGACAHVVGPNGEVTVRIVDRCPECPQGDIDLSPQAFEMIADLSAGRVDISWQYVPCSVSGPIAYRFKEGSNQWWTAVQLRNHRHAIAKLEVDEGGGFVEVPRLDYNYFVDEGGMGPGPYTFRVTDVYGHELVDTGIVHQEAQIVSGAAQFPDCTD
jgi:expansin (peptidoglycan-binding protein)